MASAEDEFTDFAESAASGLLATAYLLCGDWHAAEDLTQTTLAKVFAAWRRIHNHDAVHAYARRTMLNSYLADRRRKRHGEVLTADASLFDQQAVEPCTPELKITLTDALATLPRRARAVVVLRYWEDISVEQVAELLGCSAGNVKSQSARALDKLRVALDGALPELTARGREEKA